MTNPPKPKSITACAIIIFSLIILSNMVRFKENFPHTNLREKVAALPPPPGAEYMEFREFLADEVRAGYLTDRDMSPEKNDGSFLMAQYALAPTILEPNNEKNRFILLDYTSMMTAFKKTQHIPQKNKYINSFSRILIERGLP